MSFVKRRSAVTQGRDLHAIYAQPSIIEPAQEYGDSGRLSEHLHGFNTLIAVTAEGRERGSLCHEKLRSSADEKSRGCLSSLEPSGK